MWQEWLFSVNNLICIFSLLPMLRSADKKPPPSWIQRNFIYVLPLTMVVVNMMQAAGAPAAAERQQQQQQGRGGGRVREE